VGKESSEATPRSSVASYFVVETAHDIWNPWFAELGNLKSDCATLGAGAADSKGQTAGKAKLWLEILLAVCCLLSAVYS